MSIFVFIAGFLSCSLSYGIQRRTTPFRKEPGFAFIPFVRQVQGIGTSYGAIGVLRNISQSDTDVSVNYFTGSTRGLILKVGGMHLIPDSLMFDVDATFIQNPLGNYARDTTSDGDLFFTRDTEEVKLRTRLRWEMLERRIQFFGGSQYRQERLLGILDSDMNRYVNLDTHPRSFADYFLGANIDYTDDWIEPRKGLRLRTMITAAHAADPLISDYLYTAYSLDAYIPVTSNLTWAFNFYRSDAIIQDYAVSTDSAIRPILNLNCTSISDPQLQTSCQQVEDLRVQNWIGRNQSGNAVPLGGPQRLRAYPIFRYQGAHSLYYATEIRWNIVNEASEFDFLIFSGKRDAIQLAFFAEEGAVSETSGTLYSVPRRRSIGIGFRYLFSGTVFRAEGATGTEGIDYLIAFRFPWQEGPF